MPKVKTKSAAKKRFKLTGTGKIKRQHAFHSHILTKRPRSRRETRPLDPRCSCQRKEVRELLCSANRLHLSNKKSSPNDSLKFTKIHTKCRGDYIQKSNKTMPRISKPRGITCKKKENFKRVKGQSVPAERWTVAKTPMRRASPMHS